MSTLEVFFAGAFAGAGVTFLSMCFAFCAGRTAHYTAGGIEVIDFLEAWNFPFHLANAIKYICRAGRKDKNKTAEDLRKAIWYIERYIRHLGMEGKS